MPGEPIVPIAPAVPPIESNAPPKPPAPPVADPPKPPVGEDVTATIARLEAEVKAARAEAGKERINAKTAAAEEARLELAKQIGKALGLVTDEPPDPAKLAEQVTTFQSQAKQANLELAVFRSADTANGDPQALLDSRAFQAKVASMDPTDSAALVAAITEAVAENPRLAKVNPTAPGMKPNVAQGRSSSPPAGLDARIAAAEQAGDFKTAIRLKAAKGLDQTQLRS